MGNKIIVEFSFQSVSDGLPPMETDPYYGNSYSIECLAIVDKKLFDRSVKYCFDGVGGWVWADMALGHKPEDYLEELGGDQANVSHWAEWPQKSINL